MEWGKNIGYRIVAHSNKGSYMVDLTVNGDYVAEYHDYRVAKRNQFLGRHLSLEAAKNAAERHALRW